MTHPHSGPFTAMAWGAVRVGVLEQAEEVPGTELLSPRERGCFDALPAHRRPEWLRGRHAAKRVALELLGPDWPLSGVEVLPGPRGEPRLEVPADVAPEGLSLSHARGLSVAAVSPRGRVGVDVEPSLPPSEHLWHFFLTPSERARCAREPGLALRLWLLKEALYKVLCPPEPMPLRTLEPELGEGALRLRRPVDRDFTFTFLAIRNHLLAVVSS